MLDGNNELTMTVALPVALMLNKRFGPKEGVSVQPGEQGADAGETPSGNAPSPDVPVAQEDTHEEPTPEPDQAPQAPSDEETIEWIFPAYDYSREDLDRPEEGGRVSVTVSDVGGSLRYTWPDAKQSEVYRVVISDLEDPYSPDDFDEVAVTEGLNALDSAPWTTAVRFVTVWGYERLGDDEKYLGQCRRVASRVVVHPVAQWSLSFNSESRCVDASWEPPVAPPGATVKVRTARLPLEQSVGRYLRGSAWLSCEIRTMEQDFRTLRISWGESSTTTLPPSRPRSPGRPTPPRRCASRSLPRWNARRSSTWALLTTKGVTRHAGRLCD